MQLTFSLTFCPGQDAGGDPSLPLSDEQISHFLVEGHVVLPGILGKEYTGERVMISSSLRIARDF